MSYDNDQFRFTFVTNAAGDLNVLQMYEVEGARSRLQRISGSSFDVEQDLNGDAVAVTQTKTKRGEVEVKNYSDIDGDGLFEQDYEIEVATSTRGLERHKFTFDANGTVTQDLEQRGRYWRNDRISSDESYDTVEVDGVTYVVKTEQDWDETEFEIFRDDNGDGIFTQIAEGQTRSDALLDANGAIDFAAIQPHLSHADALIG